MSNGRTHRTVGTVAGAAFAGYQARGQPATLIGAEMLGGAIAGNFGARLPDRIDPPTSPRHRSVGHGVVPVGATGAVALSAASNIQGRLRLEAARQRQLSESASNPLATFWHWLMSVLCHVGAGAVAGVIAGYGSHLALDICTPAGLPVFA